VAPLDSSHTYIEADAFFASTHVGGLYGGAGKLYVRQGAVVLEPDVIMRRLSGVARITHTDEHVVMVKVRLMPPWYSTVLKLHDEDNSGEGFVWLWSRNRLRTALEAAGFKLHEETTWFALTVYDPLQTSHARPAR
jgi:hypothetical protein